MYVYPILGRFVFEKFPVWKEKSLSLFMVPNESYVFAATINDAAELQRGWGEVGAS
jgi:hypothetical protein